MGNGKGLRSEPLTRFAAPIGRIEDDRGTIRRKVFGYLMSTPGDWLSADVLHVGPLGGDGSACHEPANRIHEWASKGSVVLARCPDVYRALARIGRLPAGKPFRVLVCVDALTEPELAFFALARRLRPDVPVLVYGNPAFASRVRRATELGAMPLNLPTLENMLSGMTRSPAPAGNTEEPAEKHFGAEGRAVASEHGGDGIGAEDMPETSVIAPAKETAAEEPQMAKARGFPPDDDVVFTAGVEPPGRKYGDDRQRILSAEESEATVQGETSADPLPHGRGSEGEETKVGAEDEPSSPARVPWLRYNDAPRRTPPTARRADQPRASQNPSDARTTFRSAGAGPLLTDEELAALLADEPLAGEHGNQERPSSSDGISQSLNDGQPRDESEAQDGPITDPQPVDRPHQAEDSQSTSENYQSRGRSGEEKA